MGKKAVIAGSNGLIGSKLLDVLLHHPDYGEITILVRKKSKYNSKKLTTVITDFDKLEDYSSHITGDAFFCCLGTTRAKTPDMADYRKIDHDYPLQLAQIAKRNGMEQYHFVSAIGANPNARNFYTKLKGETEDDLKKVGMQSLYIYQPSLLLGKRKERRPAEKTMIKIMSIINFLLVGPFKKYRAIEATRVARCMYRLSLKDEKGVFVRTSDNI